MHSETMEIGPPAAVLPPTAAAPASRRRALTALVILAFASRLLYMGVTASYKFPDTLVDQHRPKFQVGFETGRVARSIVTGHGFASPFEGNTGPTAWLSPVYPYIAAGIFRVLGVYTTASSIAILTLNALCGALTCIPIFLIGEKLGTRRLGFWAALLWAVLPSVMAIPMTWIWETALSTLLLAWITLLTLRLEESEGLLPWFGWGLLWGVAALTNPSLTSFIPVSGLWAAWQNFRRRKPVVAPVLISALACLLTIAPWLVRNYEAFGRFVFLRSNFVAEMAYGNTPYARGIWACCSHPSLNDREFHLYADLGEIAYVRLKQQQVSDFLHRYPGLFANLTLRRAIYFWNGIPDVTSEDLTPYDMLPTWPYAAFSIVGLLGALELLRQRKKGAGLMAGLFLIYPIPYYITYPHARYRHPLEPLLMVCAVFVFAQARELRRVFYPTARSLQ